MKDYPKLSKAPIVEAVFDIRCRLPSECGPDTLKKAAAILRDDYPKLGQQLIHTQQFKVEAGKEPEFKALEGLRGFRIQKEDKSQILQLRRDGFTLNRLRPYTSFDELWPEVLRCWQVYAEATKPTEITRLALRTINRIELERGFSQLGEAFKVAVAAPIAGMQQSGFLHRWSLFGNNDCAAIVTLATRQPTDVKMSIVLDIDAFKLVDLDLDADSLTRNFLQLRELKNAIFFGSLSDVQINRYEPQQ